LLLSSQTSRECRAKWQEERDVSRVPEDEPAVFLEVSVADASEFEADLEIRREERFGYKVLTREQRSGAQRTGRTRAGE
jgi:hypothetical protein